ncbi:MAG TPA: hypothetical protein VK500_02435, partial [Nitrospiraceae bacterium]|nr:hypothetical protein [Nitrospiraceae bacterium]
MGLSVSHSLSATTPNDPAFEIQPQHWNSNHIYTLAAVGSEISGGFGNGGGVSFGLSADGKVTAAAPAGAPSPINFSAGTTSSNIGSVVFSNSNLVSFGLNGSTITGSIASSLTNIRVSGGTTSNLLSALTFGDGNGISFGLNASTLTATVKTDYLTSQSNQNVTAANGGFAFQTLSFSNANNFSFGTSAGSAITGSYTVPTVTNSSWTVSDTATSATVGRLAFTAANGITMTLSTSNNGQHTVFASYTVPTVTNSSMTVSDAATSGTLARLAFTNLNGVTLSLSTGAGGSHTIVGSHNALTSQSNQAVSNSAGSFTFQTLNFSNANNVTFGTSAGGIVTASVAAPGAAAENNWINLLGANTAGNTTASGSTIGWSGINLTFSGTNDSKVVVSAPATSSLVGTSGLSISTAGSTISVYPIALNVWEPLPNITGTGTSSHAPASIWFSKIIADWPVAVSYANVFKSLNVSAPGASSQNSSLTNKFSYSHGLTLFTRQDF